MYLSKIELNLKNKMVRLDLSNCIQMHKRIMSVFEHIEENEARKKMKILYRIIQNNNKNPEILIQSKIKPDLKYLKETDYLTRFETKNIDKIENSINEGTVLGFNIFSSPVKQNSGKRFFLKEEEEQNEWLKRKMLENGAKVISIINEKGEKVNGYKKGQYKITNIGVRFRGILKVIDKEKFLNSYKNGLGPGKSYGLGMILLYRT
jgi:CRISPR system Cascade subunit CasE